MESTNVTLQDGELLERVSRLADAMHRKPDWIVKKAVERYLDSQEWFVNSAPPRELTDSPT